MERLRLSPAARRWLVLAGLVLAGLIAMALCGGK